MKLDRLLSILMLLLRKDRVQAKELAEKFEVSTRTILRDIDAINLAGIPIVTYQGVNGGIGIAEGYRLDRSILTSDEMVSIITSLKGMARLIPESQHEILLEKLKNILNLSQLEKLESKTRQLIIDPSPWF
ncbi:MAG TPA: YafY family transcriptional regulator, partial [Firmicutes bacterium]|nr:YafY family transcriptional regulator [Bacillota bacterium]